MRGLWHIFLLTLLVTAVGSVCSATTYYVAKGGNDGWAGTEGFPWATIQHAADTMVAGDTVYIKAGTYNERVIPQNSGTAGARIAFAVAPGAVVTIDGTGVYLPVWGGLFEISDRSYLTVSGLRIVNVGPSDNNIGILIENSDHIVIEDCYTYNTTSSGIAAWRSVHITIQRNEVELACNDGEQECITVAICDNFIVADNHVHHSGPGTIGGEGIDIKDGSHDGVVFGNLVHNINRLGIYVDSWNKHTYNIDVYQNRVYSCKGSGFAVAAENGGLLEDVRLFNNLAYQNDYSGMTVGGWGEAGASHPMTDITFINNTLHNNGVSGWGGGINIENPEATMLTIRNNICSQNQSFQIADEASGSGLVVDYNLIDGYRGDTGEVRGSNYQEGDPLFVSAAGADYHLQDGSPAINNATAAGAPAEDYDGLPRPQGGGINIGAYEYSSQIFADDFETGNTSRWTIAISGATY